MDFLIIIYIVLIYIYIHTYLPYVRRSVNAGWHSFNLKHAHADQCGRNIAWSKNKDGTLVDSSLEESYF